MDRSFDLGHLAVDNALNIIGDGRVNIFLEVLSNCVCRVSRLVDSCRLSSCLNFCFLHVVGFLFQFLLQLLKVCDNGWSCPFCLALWFFWLRISSRTWVAVASFSSTVVLCSMRLTWMLACSSIASFHCCSMAFLFWSHFLSVQIRFSFHSVSISAPLSSSWFWTARAACISKSNSSYVSVQCTLRVWRWISSISLTSLSRMLSAIFLSFSICRVILSISLSSYSSSSCSLLAIFLSFSTFSCVLTSSSLVCLSSMENFASSVASLTLSSSSKSFGPLVDRLMSLSCSHRFVVPVVWGRVVVVINVVL